MKTALPRSRAFAAALAISIPATAADIGTAAVVALPIIASTLPLKLSRLTLTDGARTVELQGMTHLAAPAFYAEVRDLVALRRAEGWLVLYEEVRDDIGRGDEGTAELLARLGTEWDPGAGDGPHPYELMAPLIGEGLVLQDNASLLGRPGTALANANVSLSELLEALPPAPPSASDAGPALPPPVDLTEAREMFDAMQCWVQSRIRAALRIALATSAPGRYAQAVLPSAATSMREGRVAKEVAAAPGRSVLVIYGQAHVAAIRDRLAAQEPDLAVTSESRVRAF